jgi:2-keto-4-pentenoate hydratase
VLANTGYVVAAFEIVDSRVADWKIKLADTVADNASSGRYVLGGKKFNPNEIDLSAVTMKLYKNGELAGEGTGAAVMGDPCLSVAWLANRLWEYGVTLKAGEVILSGAFSAAPMAAKGDKFSAGFSSFGIVEAEFV